MNLRKSVIIKDTKESDETNESCSQITRVAGPVMVKNHSRGASCQIRFSLCNLFYEW